LIFSAAAVKQSGGGGEAGVGKSALIEGLALRIIAGQVPDKLRDTEL
jgi:type VI secretion system protein VasG